MFGYHPMSQWTPAEFVFWGGYALTWLFLLLSAALHGNHRV